MRYPILMLVLLMIDFPWTLRAQELHKISTEKLDALGRVVNDYVDRDLVVGAELLVLQRGNPVFHQAFGKAFYRLPGDHRPFIPRRETTPNF